MDRRIYNFAFVMDQQVGLKTHALNVERVARACPEVNAAFLPVCYESESAPLSRLPLLPESIRSTLRGVSEIREGLQGAEWDGVLWATWAAKSVLEWVKSAPAYWMMDMTPPQMRAMGAFYGYSEKRADFMASFKQRATEQLYAEVKHFFPWSQYVAESLQTDFRIAPERITVVSPGTDTTLFVPGDKPPSDRVRVLFVGGDFERKGGDLLVEWLETRRDVELHVVTRTPPESRPNLHIYTDIANNSPELVALYQQSDLFALPTRADCYSLVGLEAMACGLPVVLSSLGGTPDIVAENETGYLVPPDDKETLFGRLDALASDAALRQRMGAAARARAVERFDCTRNIQHILSVMRQGAP
jgi:glycosyltransferase involved in cell wall biosynthesis